jgi:hypothetical protein
MARLKPIISSLDEIPEDATVSVRDVYVEATQDEIDEFNDGKPFLRLDTARVGGWGVANTAKLTRALESTRKAERTLARYGDITPDEAKAALEEAEDLRESLTSARKGSKAAGEWETQKKELVEAHRVALEGRDGENAKLLRDLHIRVVREDALAALKDAGFSEHADLMLANIEPSLNYLPSDNGSPGRTQVVRDGTERLNSSAQPMTAAELAAELAGDSRFKILLDPDGASGAGGVGGGLGGAERSKPASGPHHLASDEPITVDDLDKIAEHGLARD